MTVMPSLAVPPRSGGWPNWDGEVVTLVDGQSCLFGEAQCTGECNVRWPGVSFEVGG